MPRTNFQELLDAGVHFGHLARKWNPKMAPYIFDQKNGIHIIDLHKAIVKIDEAADAMKELARSGRKILFVATKKQAKEIVAEKATAVNMPSITERWAGGMLTNFPTIRKAIKKMNTIDKMKEDGTFEKLAKRERLQVSRQREKLEKNLGSIRDMSRLPSALFVVDIQKEANAVKEANRLNIPVFAMVDTCCDPTPIDYVIPANDDATKSIELVVSILCKAIEEGLGERKLEKDKEVSEETAESEALVNPTGKKLRARRTAKPVAVEEAPAEPAAPAAEPVAAPAAEPVAAPAAEPVAAPAAEPVAAPAAEPVAAPAAEPVAAPAAEPVAAPAAEPVAAPAAEPVAAPAAEPVAAPAAEPVAAPAAEPATPAATEPKAE